MPRPHLNPSFPITRAQALAEWDRMRKHLVPLQRPVLILGGWRAPRLGALGIERLLRPLTSNRTENFLTVTYPFASSLDAAWNIACRKLQQRFGDRGPGLDSPIDVIGISMGGLVAKLASMPPQDRPPIGNPDAPRLRLHRLFTLATPHRGARLARLWAFDDATRLMRPGCPALDALDHPDVLPRIIPYAMLGDWWVGATRTAPPGMSPIWIAPETLAERALSHFLINRNPAIVADVARRLRGETPLAHPGPPPPSD
jgi:hypothetical protein